MDPERHSEAAIVQRVISPNDVPVVRVWETGLLTLLHRATGLLFSCLPWTRNGWDDGDRFSRVRSCYVLSRIARFIANRSQELICFSSSWNCSLKLCGKLSWKNWRWSKRRFWKKKFTFVIFFFFNVISRFRTMPVLFIVSSIITLNFFDSNAFIVKRKSWLVIFCYVVYGKIGRPLYIRER